MSTFISLLTLPGGVDRNGPQLFMVEPSGLSWGYFGCAAGKAASAARTQLEKLNLEKGLLKTEDAVVEAAKMCVLNLALTNFSFSIYAVHDEVKDKMFELEMSWICPASGGKHAPVPKDILKKAEEAAKKALEDESVESD